MSVTGVKFESVESRSTATKVNVVCPCKSIVDLAESKSVRKSGISGAFPHASKSVRTHR